jgi:hypothetical protein
MKKGNSTLHALFPFSQGKNPYQMGSLLQTSHPSTLSNERKPTISEEQIHLQQVKLVVIHL